MGIHISSTKQSSIICSNCNEIGGSLQKQRVDTTVRIPGQDKVTNLSKAWDYAARVLLRCRENVILSPYDSSEDDAIATSMYSYFSEFTHHTVEEIEGFESTHMSTPVKSIKNRLAYYNSKPNNPRTYEAYYSVATKPPPRHARLPNYKGAITRVSVACLYGATICLALSDLSVKVQMHTSKDQNEVGARAIYEFFSAIKSDLRYSVSFSDMTKIVRDAVDSGYHAAASLNKISTGRCLKCYKMGKGAPVEMKAFDESPSGLKCPTCGSVEDLKVALAARYVRDQMPEVMKKIEILLACIPLYLELTSMYKQIIRDGPKEDFLKWFNEYELKARKDLLCKRERIVILHYDPETKSKKRTCHIAPNKLADVHVNDIRYTSGYLPFIDKFVNLIPKNISAAQLEQARIKGGANLHQSMQQMFGPVRDLLKELGWPEELIGDKIRQDISSALLARLRT
jgi:hypothetical protein